MTADTALLSAKSLTPSLEPRRLHVAVVDEELPYPMTSGKRIRTLNLLLRLASRHRITYVCHRNADPDEARVAAAFLAQHGIESVVVDRAVPAKSGPFFYGRLLLNLLSPLPYSVATHTSSEMRATVAAIAALHPIDLWQCEWTPYAQVMSGMPGLRRLIIAHNVESQIWQRYHDTETHPLKRWYVRQQWRKFERFEKRAFAEADRTVAVSPDDARRMAEQFGATGVDVVDNGVDTVYFRPQDLRRDPARILFLGSLDWRPNLDAVKQLLERIYPKVLAWRPDARRGCGSRPPRCPAWNCTAVSPTCGRSWRSAASWRCRCGSAAAHG
jgi:polysaccharide biosynthesis protein PslH